MKILLLNLPFLLRDLVAPQVRLYIVYDITPDIMPNTLQGSNSCRGSSILEGTGSADRRIEKPTVTVKNISSWLW